MRSKTNYDQSHMKTSACIHIPAELMDKKGYKEQNRNNLETFIHQSITFRWTSWGVESALTDEEACAKFKKRADFDYIILFDEQSYEGDLKKGHCLLGLKEAIHTVNVYFAFSMLTNFFSLT